MANSDPSLHSNSTQINKSNFLQAAYDEICTRMIKSYESNKNYYDKNKIKFSFNVDDVVYRKNFVLSDASKNFSAKLAPKFIRSTVVQKKSDLAYVLRDEKGYEATYHIKDIKHI